MIKYLNIRYLMAGLWNTIFGYTVGLGLYNVFHIYTHIVFISIFANILSISMSFITYKLFVFNVRGNWLKQYTRCYLMYGTISLVSTGFLWVSVDFFKIPFWLAQGLVIPGMILFSYVGHKKFTFNKS